MLALGWYRSVWREMEALPKELRSRCKAHLDRLQRAQPGESSGLRLEKVHAKITELKVSWDKQEFRFLFFTMAHTIFIVNFFQKKTSKTPPAEIARALSRMKEVQLDQAVIVTRVLQ